MSAIGNIEAATPAASIAVEEKKEISQPVVQKHDQEQKDPTQAISRNPEALQKVAAETIVQPNIQEIYDLAAKTVELSDERDYKVLHDFYSREINRLDPEFLKKNPELIFRRALAGQQREIGKKDAVRKFLEYSSDARNDYKFVAEHAEKGSRLADVATKRLKLIEEMFSCQPSTKKELEKTINKLTDDYLRSWLLYSQSQHFDLKGRKLRKQLFQVLQNSDELQRSFVDEVVKTLENEPEVVLGRATCNARKIKLHEGRKGQLSLLVKVGYEWPKNSLFTVHSL